MSTSKPFGITTFFSLLPLCPCFLTTDMLIIPDSRLAFFMPSAVNDLTYAQSCPGARRMNRGKCKFHYICAVLQASNYTQATADFTPSFGWPGWMTLALHLLSKKPFIVDGLKGKKRQVFWLKIYFKSPLLHIKLKWVGGTERTRSS